MDFVDENREFPLIAPRCLPIPTAMFSLTLRPNTSKCNGETDIIIAKGIIEPIVLCLTPWPVTTGEFHDNGTGWW